ncbi:MAG: MlaD family protein [Candidatus Sericytochromatia bacterium]
MATNNTVKVGITVTVFAAILSVLIIWLSQYNPGKQGYNIEAHFSNIAGLLPGSKVYYMGYKIGTVQENILEADKIRVVLQIDPDIKIPKTSTVTIGAKGIVGDKAVEFFPKKRTIEEQEKYDAENKGKAIEYVKAGETIRGLSPASFEDLIIEGKNALIKAQRLIDDTDLQTRIKNTSKNIELFTASINKSVSQIDKVANNITKLSESANSFVGTTNKVMQEVNHFVTDIRSTTSKNIPNIDKIIANANSISKELDKTVKDLNAFVESPNNIKNTEDSIKSVKNAILNIEKISKSASSLVINLDSISGDVKDISSDPNLKNNFKGIVSDVKNISESLSTLSKKAANGDFFPKPDSKKTDKERLHLEFKSEVLPKVLYQFKVDEKPRFDLVGNFNILAHTGFESFPFLQLGVEEIGATNQFNLQAGFYPFNNLRLRGGLVRGKLGVGANYFNEPTNSDIFLDMYDISDPHVRIGLMQNIYKDFGITASWDNQFSKNANEFVLGIRWQPGIL